MVLARVPVPSPHSMATTPPSWRRRKRRAHRDRPRGSSEGPETPAPPRSRRRRSRQRGRPAADGLRPDRAVRGRKASRVRKEIPQLTSPAPTVRARPTAATSTARSTPHHAIQRAWVSAERLLEPTERLLGGCVEGSQEPLGRRAEALRVDELQHQLCHAPQSRPGNTQAVRMNEPTRPSRTAGRNGKRAHRPWCRPCGPWRRLSETSMMTSGCFASTASREAS